MSKKITSPLSSRGQHLSGVGDVPAPSFFQRLFKRRKSVVPFSRRSQALLFILPGFLIYAAFVLLPILGTIRYSLQEWTGFSDPKFIGLDNYRELYHDEDFRKAIGNNFFFVTFYTLIPILLGLFLTSLMSRSKLKGMAIFRSGLFVPQVMSPVVVGIIWRWLFEYRGPINEVLTLLGLETWIKPWLGDFTYAPYAVGAVGSWVQYGLCMILFLAGIQAINEELYDTAIVFGANPLQQFWYVTLPGLRQQILVAFVLTFIAALRVFDLIFVLTRSGGPGKETIVTSILVYENTFNLNRAGYGAAMAVTLGGIIVAISALVFWLQARSDPDAA
jgi:raffinose/stachyose/melibiose transport system permease protein